MTNRIFCMALLSLVISSASLAQNTNSSTTVRPRTTISAPTSTASQKSEDTAKPKPTTPVVRSGRPKTTGSEAPGSASVVDTFNALLDGIRHANVKAVSSIYLNSPRLVLFNNNGTVTKGWEQVRKNRESSYPDLKDVKLDVHDLSVTMLGRDGAVVSCLWTQSQTFKGTPETATGRMTLVFKRVGNDWKAIHLHTSPDKQDPSRVLPSEQATPTPSPSPTPKN